MKKSILLSALLGAGILFSPLQLCGREDQTKVLLPPGIGYKNLRTALSFARSFYKKGEFRKGFELFKKCSEVEHLTDLHRAECLWYAGLCAEKAGDFEKARLFYEKTLRYKGGKFTSNAVKSLKNLTASKNIFPDGSFEKGTFGAWNRMIDQSYLPDTGWVRDNTSAFHGKYSLRNTGKAPLVLMTEGSCSPGVLSLRMRSTAPRSKVRVEFFSYARFVPLKLAGKDFSLSDKWQLLVLNLPKKYLKFETGTAPLFVRVTPLVKGDFYVDCVQLEESPRSAFKEYAVKKYSLEEGKKLAAGKIPPYGEKLLKTPVRGGALKGVWEFSVSYPVSAAGVPVEMALPLPRGEWFGKGELSVRNAAGKKIPLQKRILARWPQDGSCRSVLLSFEADLKKGENRFFAESEKNAAAANLALTKPLSFTLTAEDADGLSYQALMERPRTEFIGSAYICYLFRGVLVREGRVLAPCEVRQKVWRTSGVTEISALIRNPASSSMLVLKNAALRIESGKAGKKSVYTQYFDRAKERFTHAPDGKWGSVQSAGGTLLMREASLRHPVKLTVDEKGSFTAWLWPDDVKSLLLSRKTVLHREFIYTPQQGAADALGYRSIAMAKPEYFARSRFFVLPTGAWQKSQPHFKKSLGDYGYFFSGEAERVFNYTGRFLHGLFNYGDVYGDGGWGNLESYLDFSELIYAVSMNEPRAFKWALNRSRHYRDMDIAGGVACYHSSNHAGGVGYDFSHSWPQGVLYHYLLTGDLRSLDVIREVIADYMRRPIDDRYIQGSRSLGRYLLGLADFYGFTGEKKIAERFIEQIRFTEKNELKPGRKDQTLFRWHGRLDPFHVWYGCCAMMEMYLLTGNKEILPSFRREMQNSLNPDFYRNDLTERYPGVPFEEAMPIHAGFLSCHRGALFYPLMKFYSELTGEKKYLRLAQLAAYAAFLPGETKAWPMDAMRLAVLENTCEKTLLKEVFALQKRAAARGVLNGDFSKDPNWFANWHLPAGRQMSYDDAVRSWPLRKEKEFPKLINEYRQREELVSPWRGYSRNFAWMDHEVFGEKAPALRVTLSSKWAMGKGTSLACAPIHIEKGRYRFTGRFRFDDGIDKASNIFFHLIPEGEKRARAIFPLDRDGRFKVDTYTAQNFFTGLQGQVRVWRKKGWKEFEFTFTSPGPAMLMPLINFKLNKKSAQAHAHVDDFKFERIEK